MRLSHFTDADDLVPRSEPQVPSAGFKPRGLWVSVDGPGDWVEAEIRNTDVQRRFEIVLADDANVLRLSCRDELAAFTRAYGTAPPWASEVDSHMSYDEIDWGAVAGDHQGIIIAPYVRSARFDYLWYYGWDCASGCLWDAAAIKEVAPWAPQAVRGNQEL